MLAATYAREIGRARRVLARRVPPGVRAGRDLGDRDTVLIAGAACELHPAALIKGAELRSTRARLDAATAEALAAGVRDVPAIRIGDRVFYGTSARGGGP